MSATIDVISSGSSGNCYILECSGERLIIELGLAWETILKSLEYNISNVKGCIVSHKHKDHSLSINNALKYALPVYSCEEVAGIYKGVEVMQEMKKTSIGGFRVMPLSVPHSCQCYAFLIEHNDIGRLLFCTDCTKFNYRLKNITHIMIECNYDKDVIIDNMCNGQSSMSKYENHMEIDDTISSIMNNYSPSLLSVLLIHMSKHNSIPDDMRNKVSDITGIKDVSVAERGLRYSLNTYEF